MVQRKQGQHEQQRKRTGELSRRRLRRRRKRQLMIVSMFAGFVLVLGILNLVLYRTVSKYPKDTICENIYIGSIDASGMTKKEAKKSLEQQLEADKILTVDVNVKGQSALGTLEEYGLAYENIEDVVDKAMAYGKKGSLWNRYWKLRRASRKKVVMEEKLSFDKKAAETIFAERVEPLANRAKNATLSVDSGGLTIEKEQEGEKVNVSASLERLSEYLNDNWNHEMISLEAVVEKEKPMVVEKDLKDIKDVLGEFSTDAGGGERVQNLKTGASKLDGVVLAPGEEISVCDRMVPFTAENGYVPGGTYENGKVVESYGGGICQVSTTLYNAVLYAELEVVERYPHSMTVSYVDPSRDAAIAEGLLDFKFKNNYDTPVYIYCRIEESNDLVCRIYGKETRDKGRTIEFESEILATEEAGITYTANVEQPIGYIQATSSAYTGIEACLWKVVYQDGEEISRDVCNNSSYSKEDTIIEVGILSDNADASLLVQNAIASQDESAIYAAISAASSVGSAGGTE